MEGLSAELEQAKQEFEAAMTTESSDTPRAMLVIFKLVKTANAHLTDNKEADLAGLEALARWITKVVGIFGLDSHAKEPYNGIGWTAAIVADVEPKVAVEPYIAILNKAKLDVSGLSVENDAISSLLKENPTAEFESLATSGSRDIEQLALPYVRTVSKLRDELRRIASSQSPKAKKDILALTDRIRDQDLTNLGVYLDDRPDNQPSLIKFIPTVELIAAREEKLAREAEKAKKEEARLAKEKSDQEA